MFVETKRIGKRVKKLNLYSVVETANDVELYKENIETRNKTNGGEKDLSLIVEQPAQELLL